MSNFFTAIFLRNIFKYLYKISHPKSFNHNRRYWPYFKVIRNKEGHINQVFYKKNLIADNTICPISKNDTCIIIATGPSINTTDPALFMKDEFDHVGINGAVSLKNAHFEYYVIIDHNFAKNKSDLISKVLNNAECTLFTTARCLEIILRTYKIDKVQCTFKIIEIITETKIERFMGAKTTLAAPLPDAYMENNIGFSTNIFDAIYDYYTVAYVALQIAYALNYKNILIAGLDMSNFNQPRFYESDDNKQPTRLEQDFAAISSAFETAAHFLEKQQVQVINLSTQSAIQAFKKLDAQNFV